MRALMCNTAVALCRSLSPFLSPGVHVARVQARFVAAFICLPMGGIERLGRAKRFAHYDSLSDPNLFSDATAIVNCEARRRRQINESRREDEQGCARPQPALDVTPRSRSSGWPQTNLPYDAKD